MNIFALSRDPFVAASYHCDRHVVKMIIEYAQLLSTAHRVLDGASFTTIVNDRLKKIYLLAGEIPVIRQVEFIVENNGSVQYKDFLEIENQVCYSATHVNHPCAVWARTSDSNYHWLVQLFEGVLREYEKRYAKIHATNKLREFFLSSPKNIRRTQMTPFALAMPDQYKVKDEILAYQNYYVGEKYSFAKWTNTDPPHWFTEKLNADPSNFKRTR